MKRRFKETKMRKIGLLTRLFGCHRKRMSSLPPTIDNESYLSCTNCGARRRFDPQTFPMRGGFYFGTKN